MAWQNTIDQSYSFGDKPYGNYWIEIPDSQVPPIVSAVIITDSQQLDAIRKAIVLGDKSAITAIDTQLAQATKASANVTNNLQG